MRTETVLKSRSYPGNIDATDEISARALQNERRRRTLLKVLAVGSFAVGITPLMFIIWLCNSTGANNICVDYAAFVHIVDRVLSGTYDWSAIFSDSFIRTHMVLLPVLVHILVAYFTHWDVTAELYVGLAFHLARAFLIADMLSMRASRWTRVGVFGAVSALVFSMSQSCIMIYGEASIAIGLALLGFTFALWSLVRYGRSPQGLLMMLVGGLVSSYSFGNVVPCWLTLCLALFVLPARANRSFEMRMKERPQFLVRKVVACGYWIIGVALAVGPYAYFLLTRGANNPELTMTFGLFNAGYMLNSIGRPFAKDMGLIYGQLHGAEVSTWILVGASIVLTACVMWKGALRAPLHRAGATVAGTTISPNRMFSEPVPTTFKISVLLLVFGLASLWNVSIFRTHIAPWYASFALYCWLGLFGFCLANLYKSRMLNTVCGAAGVLTIAVLYLFTNTTYRDKQFFLNARAPVSAEYLRSFTTAPTFLESTVFSNDGRPDRVLAFAGALKRHHLCVFSPNQEWSLQGQFALDNVRVEQLQNSHRVRWIDGQSRKGASSWRDYRHLNLLVPAGNTVNWRFTVPLNAGEAIFRTAVSSCRDRGSKPNSKMSKAAATVTVTPVASLDSRSLSTVRRSNGGTSGAVHVIVCEDRWKTVQLNLLPYRGKSVCISLSAAGLDDYYSGVCDNRDCIPPAVLYQYPRVDVSTPCPGTFKSFENLAGAGLELVPSNSDLSANFPRHYVHRADFPPLGSTKWQPVGIPIPEDKTASMAGSFCDFTEKERMRTDDFDYVLMNLQAVPGKTWCSMKFHFQYDDGTIDGVSMPLLPDGERHSYVYPTRLLTAKSGARLVRVMAYASGMDASAARQRRRSLKGAKAVSTRVPQDVVRNEKRAVVSGCVHVDTFALIKE